MKKALVLLMLAVLAGGVFASGANEAAKRELTVWVEKSFNDDANFAMEQRVNQFAKENNVTVNCEIIPAVDFMTKLNAAIEAGNTPDVVTANMYKVLSYGDNNPFLDVTDYVAEVDAKRPFLDASANATKIEGKNYFTPFYNGTTLLFLRTDKYKEHGAKIPTTWDEVFETAKQITEPQNGFYGFGMGSGPTDEDGCNTYRAILWSNGGGLYTKDGEIIANTNPEALALATQYKEAFEAGAIPPTSVTWGPGGNNGSYLMGEVGICYNAPTLYNALQKPEYGDLWANTTVIAPPVGKSGESVTLNLTHGWAILKNSKHVEDAVAFIKYTFDKDWYEEYFKFVCPVFAPVFEDSKTDEYFQSNPVYKAAVDYAANAYGYYGYPVETYDGRVLASKHYYQFPICQLLNNMVAKGMTPQEALDKLQADTEALRDSI